MSTIWPVDRVQSSLPARTPPAGRTRQNPDAAFSPWCLSAAKRSFDVACVAPALLLLSPGILLIAALVRITSSGPVLFRQQRAGLNGRLFTLYKFRTMLNGPAGSGPGVTKSGDPRVTRMGSILRRHKLDEIPQLYNVLRGDMSLVGPRPKLPKFEPLGMPCRPGITTAATLAFADEEQFLKDIPAADLDRFHVDVLTPIKSSLDRRYQRRATFFTDLALIFRTVLMRPPSKRRIPRPPAPFDASPASPAGAAGSSRRSGAL